MANRFSYTGPNQKKNAWHKSSFDDEPEFSDCAESSLASVNNLKHTAPNQRGQGLDLGAVWSIRNNVTVKDDFKTSINGLNLPVSSNYSRYTGAGACKSKKTLEGNNRRGQATGQAPPAESRKDWGKSKPVSSQSKAQNWNQNNSNTTNNNTGRSIGNGGSIQRKDDGDEFAESFTDRFQAGVANTEKLMAKGHFGKASTDGRSSARTSKVLRLNAAYLRSSGLGDFTPNGTKATKDDDHDGIWTKKTQL